MPTDRVKKTFRFDPDVLVILDAYAQKHTGGDMTQALHKMLRSQGMPVAIQEPYDAMQPRLDRLEQELEELKVQLANHVHQVPPKVTEEPMEPLAIQEPYREPVDSPRIPAPPVTDLCLDALVARLYPKHLEITPGKPRSVKAQQNFKSNLRIILMEVAAKDHWTAERDPDGIGWHCLSGDRWVPVCLLDSPD